MGDAPENLRQAVAALDAVAGCEVTRKSSMVRTRPWGDADQPDFVNAVVCLRTNLGAEALLDQLLDIETRLGRVRDDRRWGPRLIDLDLLLFDDCSLRSPRLEVPHPRLHERAFVLVSLQELDPALEIPGHGSVAECLNRVGMDGVEPMDVSW
jgi:2-amino-4-hydroxy-6-hydroxymethyldihydropteridine diphosphokinase